MKIAVTSQNFRTITPHAGKTRRFLVYEVHAAKEPVEIGRLDLDKMMTIHEFRGFEGDHPLYQMDLLITGSAGAGFVRKLQSHGVQVVVTGERDPVRAIVDLQSNRVNPPFSSACNPHHDHQRRDKALIGPVHSFPSEAG